MRERGRAAYEVVITLRLEAIDGADAADVALRAVDRSKVIVRVDSVTRVKPEKAKR